jgi:tetratricopeptide (TPR) repeat protein
MRQCLGYPVLLLLGLSFTAPAFAADDGAALDWARENVSAGKYADAIDLVKKALPSLAEGSAEWREAGLLLIDALRIVGKLDEAHALCDGLLKATPDDETVRLLKAELNVEVGRCKEARELYDAVIAAHPANARAWALRALVLATLNDRAALKETADHFFDLYQKNLQYYNSDKVRDPLELAYIGLGFQFENPKDAFETGFNLAEDLAARRKLWLPEIYLWSARLAHEKYSFANAEKRYAKLLEMRPKLPDALAGQAAIRLTTTHDLEQVERYLRQALEVNPSHVESNLLYAAIDLEEDRYDAAKQHLDAALAVNPNELHGLALLAFYYLDLAQPEQAREAERRALALSPKCADFYCDIG